MSEDDTEIEAPTIITPPAADAFAELMNLLAIVADARACGSRLRQLQAQTAAARSAEASLAPAKTTHDAYIAKTRTELDKRKTKLDEREVEIHNKSLLLDERERQFGERFHEADVREIRLKHRILREAGLTFNERMQSLPDWPELDRIVNGVSDAHFDQQPPAREGGGGLVSEPAPDSPTDRPPLMRSVPASRSAAARRAERRAAEPHQ
jgi:hypothetical protein